MKKFKLKRFLDKEYLHYLWDKATGKPNAHEGFIEIKEEDRSETDYELGAVQKDILKSDRRWVELMSPGELQNRNGRETMACVTFSAMNSIEGVINLLIRLVNEGKATQKQEEIVKIFRFFNLIKDNQANFSDRYIAKLSGTTYRGNNQTNVADAIRHYGLVPEEMWPWVDDWDEYYQTIPSEIINQGQELIEYIDFTYEWVNPTKFNEARQYAPVQTSVYAWPDNLKNGIYQKTSLAKNHAVTNPAENTGYWKDVFDHYEPFNKKVAWDYEFGNGMLYSIGLKKNLSQYNQTEINKLIARGLRYVILSEKAGEIYELTSSGLKYISPDYWNTLAVEKAARDKTLVGVSNEIFNKLVNY